MRKKPIIPRILRIDKVDDFKIYCIFNNGEFRIIDFKPIFKEWKIKNKENDFRYPLLNEDIFNSVQLIDNTLAWESIRKMLTLSNGQKIHVAFELDPVVLYKRSFSNEQKLKENSISKLVKLARKKSRTNSRRIG